MTTATATQLPRLTYSMAEVASILGVGTSTLYRWKDSGFMKTIKLGGRCLVRQEEIMRLLDQASAG